MPGDLVFLDTNGWLALLNASDSLHSAASLAWASLLDRHGRVVLTDWIVVETECKRITWCPGAESNPPSAPAAISSSSIPS
jgi:hypothetical protein